jgi:hypothetical protein
MNVPLPDHGVKAASDATAPDKWVTRLALPLASLVKDGVPATGRFYLNIVRSASPVFKAPGQLGPFASDALASYTTVHAVDRLAEVELK